MTMIQASWLMLYMIGKGKYTCRPVFLKKKYPNKQCAVTNHPHQTTYQGIQQKEIHKPFSFCFKREACKFKLAEKISGQHHSLSLTKPSCFQCKVGRLDMEKTDLYGSYLQNT